MSKKYGRTFLKYFKKILLWILIVIGVILLLANAILWIPAVQNKVASVVVDRLNKKTEAKIALDKIRVTLPNTVVLKDLYVEDKIPGDTLISVGFLKVSINLWLLLKKEANFDEIAIQNVYGRIWRPENDTTMNFQFLIDDLTNTDKNKTQEKSSESKGNGFQISFNEIRLNEIKFHFLDSLNGMFLNSELEGFTAFINKLDFENLNFNLHELDLKNSHTSLTLTKESEDSESSETTNFSINLQRSLELANVSFTMKNETDGMFMDTEAGYLRLADVDFSLANEVAEYGEIEINNSFYTLENISTDTASNEADTESSGSKWQISGGKISMENNKVKLVMDTMTTDSYGFNPKNLNIHLTEASLDDIRYSPEEMRGTIDALQANEDNEFRIAHMHGSFVFNDEHLEVNDFNIETGRSNLFPAVNVSYPSRDALFNLSAGIQPDISFERSTIHIDDITYFLGGKRPVPDTIELEKLTFALDVNGTLENLNINNISLHTGRNTELVLQGQISGIPNGIKTATADIRIDTLYSVKGDYGNFIPVSSDTSGFTLPSYIRGHGNVQGSLTDLNAYLNLSSGYHQNLDLQASYSAGKDSVTRIEGVVNLTDLQMGEMMQDTSTYQQLSLNGTVSLTMKGNEPQTGSALLNVKELGFKNYQYQNISFTGNLENDSIMAMLTVDDEFLGINGEFNADISDSVPALAASIFLEKIYAKQLNLTDDNIRAQGSLHGSFKGTTLKNIDGSLSASNIVIFKEQDRYAIDTISVKARNSGDSSYYSVRSPLLTLDYDGTVAVPELPEILLAQFNHYFALPGRHDTLRIPENEGFHLETEIYNAALFTEVLIPGLESFAPGRMEVRYNSSTYSFDASVHFPLIQYQNIQVDSLLLDFHSNKQSFYYRMILQKAGTEKYWLENVNLIGNISDNKIDNTLQINENDSIKYYIAANMISREDSLIGHLVSDSIILNFKQWQADEQNQLLVNNGEYTFENFLIARNSQEARVISLTEDNLRKTRLQFSNFNTGILGNLITSDKPVIKGQLDGETTLWNNPGLAITADMQITNLELLNELIGNLTFKANNTQPNLIEIDAAISGKNELSVQGTYETDTLEKFNFTASLDGIDLNTLEPFLEDNINKLQGKLTGNLSIEGTSRNPIYSGEVKFNNTTVNPVLLGTPIDLKDATITLQDDIVTFSSFDIRDVNGNLARLSGTLDISTMAQPVADLEFNANKFLLLNTDSDDADYDFFGEVSANVEASIKGPLTAPVLDLSVDILEGTDFTYIVTEQAPASIESSGIVEMKKTDTLSNLAMVEKDTADAEQLRGIALNANLSLNPEATIRIQLDPISEEQMTLHGSADMSLQKSKNGELSMVGRYTIEDGLYELKLYEFLRREFEIEEGSYLAWNGELLGATANLTAIYTVEAKPSTLLTGNNGGNSDLYSRNQPFYVYLDVTGELLSPELAFRLGYPDPLQGTEVAAVIENYNQDESARNKQVFSLLLFKQFMEPEMFSGGNGVGQQINTTARKGLNNLVSDQLNRFAEAYVEGFDIDLDIDSYENMEETEQGMLDNTQVQLDVSKSLFDDRLVISVGSAYSFSDDPQQQRAAGTRSGIIGDVSVEYLVTPSGNIRLRAFNKTEFEDVIDGEVNRTGVSILYNKDFYKFSEIFKPEEEEENIVDEETGEENNE